MFKKTKTALAALLIFGTASAAMAQEIDPGFARRDAAGASSFTGAPFLTLAAEHHKAFRSAHARLHQGQDRESDAGRTIPDYGGNLLGYGDNYDYYKDWHEACCM